METGLGKPSFLRNILVRLFLFCVFIIALRFAYVVTIRGESCDMGDFCFFSVPENLDVVSTKNQLASSSAVISSSAAEKSPSAPKKVPDLWMTKTFQKAVQFYSSVFQDLLSESLLRANYKTLCVDTQTGADVFALRELGVEDSVGVNKKGLKPLVVNGQGLKLPFKNETFDFIFCGVGVVEKSLRPGDLAAEIERTMKPEGFLVIHTVSSDVYSSASLNNLFSSFKFLNSKVIDGGFDEKTPFVLEVILEKGSGDTTFTEKEKAKECKVPGYKRDLISNAETLIEKEPEKPWITLKKNAQNIKYLSSMVDINFKPRYVYIDVGSRSYGSSIVSWFKKQYPKQNKTFEIYAIEADHTFHEQYKGKKGVTLLPYAAWVRNESLFFEINEDPGHKEVEKGRGMGRIKPVQSSSSDSLKSSGEVDEIKGFDFADWLKNAVTEKDYVVMKMDVEGTEFDLIPRLFETGAICLIDELFLECHYNRWQKCCPGERTKKYEKTYGQCLDLFTSLRKSGVLVHQWW